MDCGVTADGCGAALNCGTCETPLTCGGDGRPGQCGGPACFCSNGTSVAVDYPSAPGDCVQVMTDCFGTAPGFQPSCARLASDGGALGQPGDPCTHDADCTCDLACGTQYGQGTCDLRCTTTADCTLPYTVCSAGLCLINFCGGASGNSTIDGRCDASDAGDGTCVAPLGGTTFVQVDGGTLGICVQGGLLPTGAFCGSNSARGQSGELCVVGDDCTHIIGSISSRCSQVCDPTAADAGCLAPQQCQQFSFAGTQFGECQ